MRSLVYSIELILVMLLMLLYVPQILSQIGVNWDRYILEKQEEISFGTFISSLSNEIVRKAVFDYKIDNVYNIVSSLSNKYFRSSFVSLEYYEPVYIVPVNNTTLSGIYRIYYPFPLLVGDNSIFSFDNYFEIYDSNFRKIPFYVQSDWLLYKFNGSSLSTIRYPRIVAVLPSNKIDECSIFAFDEDYNPLKINIVEINYTKTGSSSIATIGVNITNFGSNTIYLILRNATDNSIFLCNRYNITYASAASIAPFPSNITGTYLIAPWKTIYINDTLSYAAPNVFYIHYTLPPEEKTEEYNSLNASVINYTIPSSNYKMFIGRDNLFSINLDLIQIQDEGIRKNSRIADSIWFYWLGRFARLTDYAT